MLLYGISDKYWYDGYEGMEVGEGAGGAYGTEELEAGVVSAGEGLDSELPGVGAVVAGIEDSPTTS